MHTAKQGVAADRPHFVQTRVGALKTAVLIQRIEIRRVVCGDQIELGILRKLQSDEAERAIPER